MKHFFITGLPRSRTAWLANFLTYDDCFCFHEPWDRINSLEDLTRLLPLIEKKYVGVSDAAFLLHLPELRKLFPNAPIVIVKRDPLAVIRSLAQKGLDFSRSTDKFLSAICEAEKVDDNLLTVPFEPLDAAGIWRFVAPEAELNMARLKNLEDLNITTKDEVIWAKVRRHLVF